MVFFSIDFGVVDAPNGDLLLFPPDDDGLEIVYWSIDADTSGESLFVVEKRRLLRRRLMSPREVTGSDKRAEVRRFVDIPRTVGEYAVGRLGKGSVFFAMDQGDQLSIITCVQGICSCCSSRKGRWTVCSVDGEVFTLLCSGVARALASAMLNGFSGDITRLRRAWSMAT